MSAVAAVTGTGDSPPKVSALSREDQTLLLFAGLMEGGKEDDDTVGELDRLTKLLNDDVEATTKRGESSVCAVIDSDCADTLFAYLDMRQPSVVRGHATLATSAYLKAAGDEGAARLSAFFNERVARSTYDDYIVAFCVAAAVFPIVPDLTANMFLSEGFLSTLGPLMRRTWKSRKVETACLEMLNVACMNAACRDAVTKYCSDWLEEIVDQDPDDVVKAMYANNGDGHPGAGSISMRHHSKQVQNLAAVILAKIKVAAPSQGQGPVVLAEGDSGRVEPATTSIEALSKMFTDMLLSSEPESGTGSSTTSTTNTTNTTNRTNTTTTLTRKTKENSPKGTSPEDSSSSQSRQNAIEGLAYASLQPAVKEALAANDQVLTRLVQVLREAPPRSPLTYGALSIVANLTRYPPAQSEEQKRLGQLKAYANAMGRSAQQQQQQQQQLDDNEHVAARCQRVFAAGMLPVLVAHSRHGSPASLALIVGILLALSVTPRLRGVLAQQGAVRLLIDAWAALEGRDAGAQRTAAQALARILISTNPAHVFGGTRPVPLSAAIRPLASLVSADSGQSGGGPRDLLPAFEGLMALTNLASTDDDARAGIVRACFADVEELLLSSHARVARAAVELVCNLVQADPTPGGPGAEVMRLYLDTETATVRNRLHILAALADAEDAATRAAAGGALAMLLGYEPVVAAVVALPRGAALVLGLCGAGESEGVRHRGAVAVHSMAVCGGATGRAARAALRAADGVAVLTACVKASRSAEVVEAAVQALTALLGEEEEGGGDKKEEKEDKKA